MIHIGNIGFSAECHDHLLGPREKEAIGAKRRCKHVPIKSTHAIEANIVVTWNPLLSKEYPRNISFNLSICLCVGCPTSKCMVYHHQKELYCASIKASNSYCLWLMKCPSLLSICWLWGRECPLHNQWACTLAEHRWIMLELYCGPACTCEAWYFQSKLCIAGSAETSRKSRSEASNISVASKRSGAFGILALRKWEDSLSFFFGGLSG